MKKQKLLPSLLMMGLMMAVSSSTFSVSASSGYGGGTGTESDPYLISTPDHLNQLQLDVNVNGIDTSGKHYRLANDIDLSNYDNDLDETNGNFTPIGKSSSISFKGTFDGNGKVISNLEVILSEQNYVGMFGYVSSATIKNVGLENVVIEGSQYIGGLVGYNYGTISESYATGEVSGSEEVGGLVGYNQGTIALSYATSNVNGSSMVGGLVGDNFYSDISESYATGNVNGDMNVGGLVGKNYGAISKSYATGKVSGKSYIGGMVGFQSNGAIEESYATGGVSGGSSIGGFIGYSLSSETVKNSYWDVETTGQSSSKSGIGLTTKQMTKRKAKENMTGFDFDNIWQESNGYPLLHWQTPNPISGGEEDLTINGTIEATILSLTIPSESMTFALNPNEEVGKQFIASDFELINGSQTPLTLEVKSFEQVTDVLNDVESTKYNDWTGLNKTQSKDIALALVPKTGDGWLSLNEGNRWVVDLGEMTIGTIKGNSTVSFGFEAKHGSSFTETLTPQYRLTFVFGLQD